MGPRILFVVLVFYISYSYGETVPVDFIDRCSIKDNECTRGIWQKTLIRLADGVPNLNIQPLDPLKIDNIVVDVPGLVTLSFNGILKGFKSCIFDSAKITLNRGHSKEALDLHCNISIKGRYDVKVNNTLFLGAGNEGLFKANGIGKVKLDNLKFKFLLDFLIIKEEDGVVKFLLKDGPMGYKYNIGGPVVFSAKDIIVGGQDISPFIISFVNQNWRFVLDTFGGPFFQRAMEIVSDIEREFFRTVPASSYFTENLDQFVLKDY